MIVRFDVDVFGIVNGEDEERVYIMKNCEKKRPRSWHNEKRGIT